MERARQAGINEYQIKLNKERLIHCIHNLVLNSRTSTGQTIGGGQNADVGKY